LGPAAFTGQIMDACKPIDLFPSRSIDILFVAASPVIEPPLHLALHFIIIAA
jgi:hypothetical protein